MDYWQGFLNLPAGRGVPVGTIDDGSIVKAELDGIGASLGPSVIPVATQPVPTNPSSWTCNGTGCSVVTGILAPDGTATAGEIDSGSTNASVYAYFLNTSTSAGDWILYGAWVRRGANATVPGSKYGGAMALYSYSATDVFNNNGQASNFQSLISGDWWHPVVAATQVVTGTAAAHNIRLGLFGGGNSGQGNQFWMPFMIYIPASAGFSVDEVERIRQQLLHGVVPPGMPAGGGVLGMNSSHKLYWGSDTDLYRGAAGVVQTDGSLKALGSVQAGTTNPTSIAPVTGVTFPDGTTQNTTAQGALSGSANDSTARAAASAAQTTANAALPKAGGTLTGPLYTNAEYSNGTCTTAATITPVNGNSQKITLTNGDTCALTFTQPAGGTVHLQLKIVQSSSGSFNGTISGGKWPGGTVPTITATSGATDFISCYLDGTNTYCQSGQNFQ